MEMKKIFLILIAISFSIIFMPSVTSEDEWKVQDSVRGTYSNSSMADFPHDGDEREVKPYPKPVLDIPVEIKVFYFITVVITLIVLLLYSKKRPLYVEIINKNIVREIFPSPFK